MATLVHYLESVFIILVHLFPHITHHIIASDGRPCLREKCATCLLYNIEHLLLSPLRAMVNFVPLIFLKFQNKHLQPTHFVA